MSIADLRSRGVWFWIGIGAVAALLTVYFIFDPSEANWMPRCMLNYTTGLECPGCGSQRALHALLHGDMIGAFQANAMLVCLLPVLALYAVVDFNRKKMQKAYIAIHRPWVLLVIMGFVIVWGVVRNLPPIR